MSWGTYLFTGVSSSWLSFRSAEALSPCILESCGGVMMPVCPSVSVNSDVCISAQRLWRREHGGAAAGETSTAAGARWVRVGSRDSVYISPRSLRAVGGASRAQPTRPTTPSELANRALPTRREIRPPDASEEERESVYNVCIYIYACECCKSTNSLYHRDFILTINIIHIWHMCINCCAICIN